MEREILVVTIHVGSIGFGEGLVQRNWTLDSFVFRVKHFGDITLKFITLRLYIFNSEADDCASDLHCHRMLCL